MGQILIIVGAAVLGALGTIHLFYTFFTDKFAAYDSAVTKAMAQTSPVISKETTLWNAWVGFNASHSLGMMLFAAIYLPLAADYFTIIQQSVWFSTLPMLVGLAYLTLAKKYWFKIPFFGILIATLCFTAAVVIINL